MADLSLLWQELKKVEGLMMGMGVAIMDYLKPVWVPSDRSRDAEYETIIIFAGSDMESCYKQFNKWIEKVS